VPDKDSDSDDSSASGVSSVGTSSSSGSSSSSSSSESESEAQSPLKNVPKKRKPAVSVPKPAVPPPAPPAKAKPKKPKSKLRPATSTARQPITVTEQGRVLWAEQGTTLLTTALEKYPSVEARSGLRTVDEQIGPPLDNWIGEYVQQVFNVPKFGDRWFVGVILGRVLSGAAQGQYLVGFQDGEVVPHDPDCLKLLVHDRGLKCPGCNCQEPENGLVQCELCVFPVHEKCVADTKCPVCLSPFKVWAKPKPTA
jgi:hypothetical protein